MIINVAGNDYELDFTFNSFKYMGDLDISELSTLEQYPFRMFSIVSVLFNGALNHNPKVRFTEIESDELLAMYLEDHEIADVTGELMDMLNETGFFKNRQK